MHRIPKKLTKPIQNNKINQFRLQTYKRTNHSNIFTLVQIQTRFSGTYCLHVRLKIQIIIIVIFHKRLRF